MRRILLPVLLLALSQPACIVAGGYSSDKGWYLWPGSLISILVVIFLAWRLKKGGRR